MKHYLFSLLFACSVFAGTYDDSYNPIVSKTKNDTLATKSDQFMSGTFLEIKRFDQLDFCDKSLHKNSDETFNIILATIKSYISQDKNIKIKIIGHSSEKTDNYNTVDFNMLKYKESMENANLFAQTIANKLEDNDINKSLLYVENRVSQDSGFTSATNEGKKLSNRVMVTMYVDTSKEEVTK